MTDAAAAKAKKIAKKHEARPVFGESIALHRCYGEIGIPAVAAAARYQGGAKNPAYAPVKVDPRDRDSAAVV